MSKKLDKLTPEQEAKMIEYRDKGIAIGLNTDRLNKERVIEAVNKTYRLAGLKELTADQFQFVSSPKQLVEKGKELLGDDFNIYSHVCFGQSDIDWIMFDKFFKDECGIEGLERIEGLYDSAVECGWFLPLDTLCVVSEKPLEIHMSGDRLHNTKGPSFLYADGFSFYHLNGIEMKPEYIEQPLTANIIMSEPNVDVRRELMQLMGLETFVKEVGGVVLDTYKVQLNGKECTYQLLDIQLGTKDEPVSAKVLKMDNPSINAIHVEGVEDDCITVKEALAWRNGFDQWKEPEALT